MPSRAERDPRHWLRSGSDVDSARFWTQATAEPCLPVEELLRRARPLPPHEDMIIERIDMEEGRAFLAAMRSDPRPQRSRSHRHRHGRLRRRPRSGSPLVALYEPIFAGRPFFLSFRGRWRFKLVEHILLIGLAKEVASSQLASASPESETKPPDRSCGRLSVM